MPESYYGQPLLKPPVWTWEVPAYFFVGGVAGVAAVIAAVGAMAGGDVPLVRDARWLAAIGGLISPVLLVSDLGRPSRFLYMLRVFKTQSPMSMGAWTLAVFTPAVLAALIWDPVAAAPQASFGARVLGHVGSLVGAATGLVLATYTGVLISVTAIPVWAAHVRALPFHFGASSLGAAVSILELLGHRTPAMNALGLAAAASVTFAWSRIELDRRPASTPLVSGRSGVLNRLGDLLSGPLPLVLRLVWPALPIARAVAAITAIAGSVITRFGWIAAGRASVVVGLVLALVLPGSTGLSAQKAKPDLSTKALVEKAAQYVANYQDQFKFLLADEAYTQAVTTMSGTVTQERTMKGELFLTYMAGDQEWIAVHDFTEVDGQPVPDREDVRLLLQRSDVRGVASRIANRNAQFNIGRLVRNFNQPTLPLLLLGPKRVKGVSFERREVIEMSDRTLVALGFTERERPTLVRNVRGSALYSRGTIVIDALTGRVEGTEIGIVGDDSRSWLTTEYASDPKVGLWVPTVFRERYESSSGRDHELIRCEARYTNYRRFEVTGKIK